MLNLFNNKLVIIICLILLFFIIKKIYNLNKPFNEKKYIEQYVNQQKFEKNFDINVIPKAIPTIANILLI